MARRGQKHIPPATGETQKNHFERPHPTNLTPMPAGVGAMAAPPVLLDVRSHCTGAWSGSFLGTAAWWRFAGREARPDGVPSRCKVRGISPLISNPQDI